MTKTLTEQYKFGEIKTGYYWCKIWGEDALVIKWLVEDNEIHQPNLIEEVLAPVPSYDEIKRLQEQLKEANKVIKKYAEFNNWEGDDKDQHDMTHFVGEDIGCGWSLAKDYLVKWGVK